MCEDKKTLCHLLGHEWGERVWVKEATLHVGRECLLCGATEAKVVLDEGFFERIDSLIRNERRWLVEG